MIKRYTNLRIIYFTLLPICHSDRSDPPTGIGETLNDSHHLSGAAGAASSDYSPTDMGRKSGGGGCAPFRGETAWSPTNTMSLGRGLPPHRVTSWSIQRFGHNRHWPKIGGCAPLGGAVSPSNIMSSGPRPTSMPSFTIHQHYRHTGQGRQGEPFYKQPPKNILHNYHSVRKRKI